MAKDFVLQTFLTSLDALQNCKDIDPKRFCFYARADGEAFGELPADIQRQLAEKAAPTPTPSGRRRPTDWDGKYKIVDKMTGCVPGQSVTLVLEDEAHLGGVRGAMSYQVMKLWGNQGGVAGKGKVITAYRIA